MATIKDIARIAGVSTSTVSHVMNNSRYVSDAMRERILAVAAEVDYTPCALAKSLKIKRTHTLGMVVTDSDNPFFAEVVQAVEKYSYEKGYQLILCNTLGVEKRFKKSVEALLQKRIDGLLLMCASVKDEAIALSNQLSVPIVAMDWEPPQIRCDRIQDNSRMGGQIATQFLIDQGHEHIACITGPKQQYQARMRYLGFENAMRINQLCAKPEWIVEGNFDCESGYQALTQMMQLADTPSAVFACNDLMAIGALKAANDLGVSIPGQLSLIGYDDIKMSHFTIPSLTSIHQPKSELGRVAVDTLLARIQSPELPEQLIELTPELVVRDTVASH